MFTRPSLSDLGLPAGKRTRLHRLLFGAGLGNGTALLLPYDQGMEHGPRDFFANPHSGDPRYVLRLAREGQFNGIVVHIGLAEKFFWDYAGEVPLILKLNGKTDIPPDEDALSPLHAGVEDAVRLGADAVGYTLCFGTAAQERDLAQYREVRVAALRLGMPLIVWAFPRGRAVAAKGGEDSFYAVDYAARVASEVGADVVTVNFPHPEKTRGVPDTYTKYSMDQAMRRVVRSANRTMTLVAGGAMQHDDAMLEKARMSMQAGATGLIVGRNVWQRPHEESLRLVDDLHKILDRYPGSVH